MPSACGYDNGCEMNAYNPLDSMKRLEAAGLERRQAEAIASEIGESGRALVWEDFLKQQLDALSDKLLVRIGLMVSGIIALACTIIGVVITVK